MATTALVRERWAQSHVGRQLTNVLRRGSLVIALLILALAFTAFYPAFLAPGNIMNILLEASVMAIVAIGQTFVIMTAGIDLSVGSILAFSAMAGALLMTHGYSPILAVGVMLVAGLLAGALNGITTVVMRITPFIVTLGTMSVFSGLALVVNNGNPVWALPSSFTSPLTQSILSVPVPVVIMVALVLLFTMVLRFTKFGQYALAMGGNEEAARLSGIPVAGYKVGVYALAGLMAAVGGIVLTGRLGTADPTAGTDMLLTSIAAAVMGGASLFGGTGSIIGSAVGAIVISALQAGLTLLGVAVFYQIIAVGVVIILAVGLDSLTRSRA